MGKYEELKKALKYNWKCFFPKTQQGDASNESVMSKQIKQADLGMYTCK